MGAAGRKGTYGLHRATASLSGSSPLQFGRVSLLSVLRQTQLSKKKPQATTRIPNSPHPCHHVLLSAHCGWFRGCSQLQVGLKLREVLLSQPSECWVCSVTQGLWSAYCDFDLHFLVV